MELSLIIFNCHVQASVAFTPANTNKQNDQTLDWSKQPNVVTGDCLYEFGTYICFCLPFILRLIYLFGCSIADYLIMSCDVILRENNLDIFYSLSIHPITPRLVKS